MMRLLFLLLCTGIFLGCEKDNDPTIEGKWDQDKLIDKEYYGGVLISTQELDITGETIEFRSDGQVEILDQAGKRVGPYTQNSDTLTFLSVTYQIQNLTKHSVTLLDHHVHGPGDYHDTYLFLTR